MDKLIFITLDGCRNDIAEQEMGYLGHLVERKLAAKYIVQSELPSVSRPMYEVLMTGIPTYQNGIYSNESIRKGKTTSVFDLVRQNHGTTACAGFYWNSELFNDVPYDPWHDRFQDDEEKPIQHGIYYFGEYPDNHLFLDGEYLLNKYQPDFMYIHAMDIDTTGHKFNGLSAEYRSAVHNTDAILSEEIHEWLELGYQIIITADHGIDEFGAHGGLGDAVRQVPLYIISSKIKATSSTNLIPMLQIAPLTCYLLGIQADSKMEKFEKSYYG